MKNFKINERVVCIGKFRKILVNHRVIGETDYSGDFTKKNHGDCDVYIELYEYCYDFSYVEQCFIIDKFEKIVPSN
jgi:hypothetical protein